MCAQLEEVCKNVPFEAKLHHAILKPPPQTSEESQYRCTVCSRPLKSILGTKAHMQTGAALYTCSSGFLNSICNVLPRRQR